MKKGFCYYRKATVYSISYIFSRLRSRPVLLCLLEGVAYAVLQARDSEKATNYLRRFSPGFSPHIRSVALHISRNDRSFSSQNDT